MHLRNCVRYSLLLGMVCVSMSSLAADVVVIAGGSSSIGQLSKDQVSDLFQGKTTALPGGGKATLLDQPESSPLREAFYSKVSGKSAASVKSTWAKLSFTGKGTPPGEGASDDDIKKKVSGSPTALGYINKSAVDGSVKVVFEP